MKNVRITDTRDGRVLEGTYVKTIPAQEGLTQLAATELFGEYKPGLTEPSAFDRMVLKRANGGYYVVPIHSFHSVEQD